jgi:hypothetical protein
VRIDQRQQVEPALFIIERGSTIRGIVRAGAEKTPLAGVQLVLTRPGSVEQHRAVTSDDEGEFELARLTGGDFVLTAHVPDGAFARASVSVDDLGTEEVRVVELHLADGSASVSGTLRDTGGAALPFGALVAERLGDDGAVLGRSTTRADSGGRFTFAALPIGRWRIGADLTYCRQHNWTCSAPVTIDLAHGEPPPIDVRLARGAAIDGRVESASQRGAVLLRLHFPDGTQREQQSLGDGAFAFGGLAAGAYELEALDPEFEHGAALARMIVQLSTGEMQSVSVKVP